ncbi:hypothetical protein POTOM_055899 [Populus tomentosa]|uniref:Histone H2A n=1 Tax=Populus tomentosa TaxID=118781 RepID=A0A8X7Y200_POPTO|nr:hypothetical protein POTOM_055899 [Populus tomentosa]
MLFSPLLYFLLPPLSRPSLSCPHVVSLQFTVGRITRFLKAGKYVERVGPGAPVYLAAVLEYLAAEDWHESSMKSIWDAAWQRDFGNWLTGKLFGVNYISL